MMAASSPQIPFSQPVQLPGASLSQVYDLRAVQACSNSPEREGVVLYDPMFLNDLHASLQSSLSFWSFSPAAQLSLVTISENVTYQVQEPANGRKLILRVHRPHYHSLAEIKSELDWISALHKSGEVATAAPVLGVDNALVYPLEHPAASLYVVAFELLPGKAPTTEDDLEFWFLQLGRISARLHRHARSWSCPSSFIRKCWDFRTTVGEAPRWGNWTNGLGLDSSGVKLLNRTLEVIRQRLEQYGCGADRFGLIHADLHLANLLVDNGTMAVIDFDDCGFSWFMYDFASAISFIEHEPRIPALKSAWVSGYREIGTLSVEDEAMLPVLVMLRRILLMAWIASHAETPAAQAAGIAHTQGTLELASRFMAQSI
jgi:Ser/Thr protein kinase RdoA (MazF antagonist)